jgi:hypothetical protein
MVGGRFATLPGSRVQIAASSQPRPVVRHSHFAPHDNVLSQATGAMRRPAPMLSGMTTLPVDRTLCK